LVVNAGRADIWNYWFAIGAAFLIAASPASAQYTGVLVDAHSQFGREISAD
jgi:hypothetical protein